ncbi:MAG: class I SAM-dependent methyltransferase [Acidimicrobiia bacterium]
MVGSRAYDFMYRWWAPWDGVGVREDLANIVDRGVISPATHPRTVDLGCGSGANVVYLAGLGFDSYGVDFSPVALDKARARAVEAGVDASFVVGDLTADSIPGLEGSFDFLMDFGTLDDLKGEARDLMVATIDRLSRPGSIFLEWCFYGASEDLPRISFSGPSRLSSSIEPGELEERFGERWDIEPLSSEPQRFFACFLLRKRQ